MLTSFGKGNIQKFVVSFSCFDLAFQCISAFLQIFALLLDIIDRAIITVFNLKQRLELILKPLQLLLQRNNLDVLGKFLILFLCFHL